MAKCNTCYHFKVCKYASQRVCAGTKVSDLIHDCIDYKPTSAVEEVRYGEWVRTTVARKSPDNYYYWDTPLEVVFVCSECGRTEKNKEPYCHCGAKMYGGNN